MNIFLHVSAIMNNVDVLYTIAMKAREGATGWVASARR